VDVGKLIMYVIATTILVCTAMVLVFKGVDAMPFNWVGLVGAVLFFAAALGMTRLPAGHE
jgi:hypothetical protein